VFGARTICRALIQAVCEKVPELAKLEKDFDIVVSQQGRGEFFDLQQAVNSVPAGKKCRILVADGEFGDVQKPKGSKVKIIKRK
jgi:pectinesterase